MRRLNFKKEITGSLDQIIATLTESLKNHGFGVLTRIDFDQKMKEKLNKEVPATFILGACNPQMAYEAYCITSDVTSLVPCNAVVREIGQKRYSVERVSPAALIQLLDNQNLVNQAEAADAALQTVLAEL